MPNSKGIQVQIESQVMIARRLINRDIMKGKGKRRLTVKKKKKEKTFTKLFTQQLQIFGIYLPE